MLELQLLLQPALSGTARSSQSDSVQSLQTCTETVMFLLLLNLLPVMQ